MSILHRSATGCSGRGKTEPVMLAALTLTAMTACLAGAVWLFLDALRGIQHKTMEDSE